MSTIESAANMGYIAMKPEQLQVVANILGRRDVMKCYITFTFSEQQVVDAKSPDHFLPPVNGQATPVYKAMTRPPEWLDLG